VVSDLASLKPGHGLLSLVTNASGGIMDDTVITVDTDHVYMVVNGATKIGDLHHFQQQLSNNTTMDVRMEYLEDTMQLLALQGPGAAAALQKILPTNFDLQRMPFMSGVGNVTLDGGVTGCRITRYVCACV
jgi:aminomethyltransferase